MTPDQIAAKRKTVFNAMDHISDSIYKSIVTDAKADLPKLPEQIFVDYFLPFFAGQIEPADHVVNWISVAGSPSQEVMVINNLGVEMFVVPGLLNTRHIQRLRPEGSLPFMSIIAMSNALNTKSPAQAHNLFIQSMLERYRQVHNSNYQPTEDELRWIEIFTRYSVMPSAEVVGAEAVKAVTAPVSDDIGDDEFKMG